MDKIKYKTEESVCACAVSLNFLGDKWSLIIIRDLFRNRNTFSQFLKESAEGIATNILVDRLKKLTSYDIIGFRRNSKDKKVKEYYLTDRGVELYPILYELQLWTIKNVDFNPSENTTNWKKFTETNTEQEVVKHYTEEYKKTRLKQFGF
jgi:DNA-binding HxlR family transcriptional regulator|tara:strand:+ start:98 stop:547 length:450 start_codon:yes stop_codon:yes gene_type:complete